MEPSKPVSFPVGATEFPLVEPFRFETRKRVLDSLSPRELLLAPVVAGICGSEIHYFLGLKDEEKLRERLPMCLLHEGVCRVLHPGKSQFPVGSMVVPIPMRPCGECPACIKGAENLCSQSKFMAATADGMARTAFAYPWRRVVALPRGVTPRSGALTEPLSIAYRTVAAAGLKGAERVAVLGDGPIGYFVALMVSTLGKIPRERLWFLGVVDKKLEMASSFATSVNTKELPAREVASRTGPMQVCFECVGGRAGEITLGQAIEILEPLGALYILGLSPDKVPVKMIDVVNKGLTLQGCSRSRPEDYERVLELLQEDRFNELAARVVDEASYRIRGADDLEEAFRFADTGDDPTKHRGRVMVEMACADQ